MKDKKRTEYPEDPDAEEEVKGNSEGSLSAGRKQEATARNVSGKISKFGDIYLLRKYGGGLIRHYPSRELELIGGRRIGGREGTREI